MDSVTRFCVFYPIWANKTEMNTATTRSYSACTQLCALSVLLSVSLPVCCLCVCGDLSVALNVRIYALLFLECIGFQPPPAATSVTSLISRAKVYHLRCCLSTCLSVYSSDCESIFLCLLNVLSFPPPLAP